MRQNNQQANIKLHWKTKYKGRSFTKLPSVYSQPLYIYKGKICNIWVRHFNPATLSYAEVHKTLNETHTPFFLLKKVTWAFTKLVLNPALLYKHTFGPTKILETESKIFQQEVFNKSWIWITNPPASMKTCSFK